MNDWYTSIPPQGCSPTGCGSTTASTLPQSLSYLVGNQATNIVVQAAQSVQLCSYLIAWVNNETNGTYNCDSSVRKNYPPGSLRMIDIITLKYLPTLWTLLLTLYYSPSFLSFDFQVIATTLYIWILRWELFAHGQISWSLIHSVYRCNTGCGGRCVPLQYRMWRCVIPDLLYQTNDTVSVYLCIYDAIFACSLPGSHPYML